MIPNMIPICEGCHGSDTNWDCNGENAPGNCGCAPGECHCSCNCEGCTGNPFCPECHQDTEGDH